MIIDRLDQVTPAVLEAMANTPDARLGEIMRSLVTHLHSFARDVRLTEPEWEKMVEVMVRLGQLTNDTHNEVVLASDAVGLSTLVCLMNNGDAGNTETAAALLGPFWRMNAPRMEHGASIVRSPTPGPALEAHGLVKDAEGKPIADVTVDVWQASPVGMYENQDEAQANMNLRGVFKTDAAGKFWFRSVKPGGYPVPTHGPVGELLRAQNRHPFRPSHIHFLLHKPGFKTLISQVFVDDDERLETDVVFGVTNALIGKFLPDDNGGFRLDHAFTMERGEMILPRPPIK